MSMPAEAMMTMRAKAVAHKNLIDAIEKECTNDALLALVECAMTDIPLFRLTPTLDQVGLKSVMDASDENDFRRKLKRTVGANNLLRDPRDI